MCKTSSFKAEKPYSGAVLIATLMACILAFCSSRDSLPIVPFTSFFSHILKTHIETVQEFLCYHIKIWLFIQNTSYLKITTKCYNYWTIFFLFSYERCCKMLSARYRKCFIENFNSDTYHTCYVSGYAAESSSSSFEN